MYVRFLTDEKKLECKSEKLALNYHKEIAENMKAILDIKKYKHEITRHFSKYVQRKN